MISEKLNIRRAPFQTLPVQPMSSLAISHLWQGWNCALEKHKRFGQIMDMDMDKDKDTGTDLDIVPSER